MDADVLSEVLHLAPQIAARFACALEAESMADMLVRCAAILLDFIGADEVLLTQLDLVNPTATVVAAGSLLHPDADLTRELVRAGPSHPAVRSYLTPGDDGRPRRVSDVTDGDDWRRHLDGTTAFRAHGGVHQLSIVSTLRPTHGRGWVLMREECDFSDREVGAAAQLLPALTVLDRIWSYHSPGSTVSQAGWPLLGQQVEAARRADHCEASTPLAALPSGRDRSDGGVDRSEVPTKGPTLTRRQREVLHLLAEGLSARMMARTLGISERTLNKHVQMLYLQLEAHDRVNAILAAHRHGLLRL